MEPIQHVTGHNTDSNNKTKRSAKDNTGHYKRPRKQMKQERNKEAASSIHRSFW